MGLKVCLIANCLGCPQYGGHLWVYLNWALGLRSVGAEIIWMEPIAQSSSIAAVREYVAALTARLAVYGLADQIALCSWSGEPLPELMTNDTLDLDAALEADLLVNLAYTGVSESVIKRFKRSALIDIDPGLTQIWISEGQMAVGGHQLYYTIGETVGTKNSPIPDCDLEWHYTAPPIFLKAWPVGAPTLDAPLTTITNWRGPDVRVQGVLFANGKRDGFLPFVDLPALVDQPMQLAVNLEGEPVTESAWLRNLGWELTDPHVVASTPWDYQTYIQNSFGEFSCAKPSCSRFQNAWISDRTICYLASAKPAVVQHTGPSRFLPDDAGLFRFHDKHEAADFIKRACEDYDYHCRLARRLAEEYFDSTKILTNFLERALS